MADFQIKKNPKSYDVCIVGSGAGGGMTAYMLAEAGVKVLLLEAGPMYDPKKNVTQLKWPWESPCRGASTPHGILVILMQPMVDGRSMANLIPTKTELSLIGSDPEC